MSQPGRNDACPCGSGKKYKHCCALNESPAARAPSAPPSLGLLLETGLAHHQAGRLTQAEQCYQQILQRDAAHADALHLLGVIAQQVGQPELAIDLITRAIESNPNYAAFHSNLGRAYQSRGLSNQAIASYRRALALQPEFAEAHNNLGNALQERQDYSAAQQHYERALALKPDYVEARGNLGRVYAAQGDFAAAITQYRKALSHHAADPGIHADLAQALHKLGKFDDAIEHYRQALASQAEHAPLHYDLGQALEASGATAVAAEHYRRAVALQPDHLDAWHSLAYWYAAQDNLAAAIDAFQRVLALQPDYAEAHNNLGFVLRRAGHFDAAFGHLQQALKLRPDYMLAYNNLGTVLHEQGHRDAAIAAYCRALQLAPDYAEAYNNLGLSLMRDGLLEYVVLPSTEQEHRGASSDHAQPQPEHLAVVLERYRQAWQQLSSHSAESHYTLSGRLHLEQIETAMACFRQALTLKPDYDIAHSNQLLHLNYLEALAPEVYLREARAFGARVSARAQAYTRWSAAESNKLRIGFVSGDLRNHPVGFFLESVVAHLDPARFELVAYVTKPGEDSLTARLKPHFAQWHSLLGLNDHDAAQRIHDDGIQILVDLAGHTADNRLPVFAWKPAPVQVAWLGYFASTGVKEIDYIIADPQVLPESEESHFSETPWRLPDCYLCFTPPHHQIEVGVLPALANGYVTFGCFNKLSKMNDAVVALWARVLHAVPDARLLLKAKELHDGAMQQLTRARFAAHGIDPQRLLLEGFTPRAAYLAEYQRVDIALDPFPFPGGTTTVEALWMGVPILSRRGARFISHAGESLLQTAGLGAWVAQDDDDYIQLAQAYAADLAALAATRAGLREQLVSSPLCDAARFAAHLGAAFNGMWQTYLARSATQEADA